MVVILTYAVRFSKKKTARNIFSYSIQLFARSFVSHRNPSAQFAMSLVIRSFVASDAKEARRLVLDHFFILRRQRTVADIFNSPLFYALLAVVAAIIFLVTKSLRVSCIGAALGPISVYLFLRLAGYFFENVTYRDMATDEKFVSYWLQGGEGERKLCVVRDEKTKTLVGIGGLSKEKEEGVVELKRMVVHSDYRRRGIARAILNCLLDDYANDMKANTVTLITQSNLYESVKLYKDAGFTVYKCYSIGIGPFKMVSTYIMRLKLNERKIKSK